MRFENIARNGCASNQMGLCVCVCVLRQFLANECVVNFDCEQSELRAKVEQMCDNG